MLSLFQRNSRVIFPDCMPIGPEILVQVDRSWEISCAESTGSSRFVFRHRIKKLLYFSRFEGPLLTYQKVRAARMQVQVGGARVLAFVSGQYLGRSIVALGPLACREVRSGCFPANWVAAIPDGRDEVWCLRRISEFLESRSDLVRLLYDYSPFSGIVPAFSLAQILIGEQSSSDGKLAAIEELPRPWTETLLSATAESRSAVTDSNTVAAITTDPTHAFSPWPTRLDKPGRTLIGRRRRVPWETGVPTLFVAGAGAYVHAYVLPALKGLRRHTVVDINPLLAVTTARRFGFSHAEASIEIAARRLSEVENPIFVIATYHSNHVSAAEIAFAKNPHTKILVEKPPVTNYQDLDRLLTLRKHGAWVEVGYNRRFSPLMRRARSLIERESGPILMFCLVKELPLPSNHWYYWPTQGTRITGNLCHWVDLGVYLIDSEVMRVEAESAPGSPPGDEVSATVYFADGSKLVLLATDRGNALRGVQEYINIRRGDMTIAIDDFLSMEVLVGGKSRRYQPLFRDKGHWRMYDAFRRAVVAGERPSYSDEALGRSSDLYLRIRDAVLVES